MRAASLPELPHLEETFEGPPAVRRVVPLLRRMPPALAVGLLAWGALADGLIRRRRFLRAWRWAGAQDRRGLGRVRLAAALLLNHGRFIAQEAVIGAGTDEAFRVRSRVDGLEHLQAAGGGAIVLGLHVGPPRSWLALRAHGVPVSFAIRSTAGQGPQWESWIRAGIVVPLPSGEPRARLQALYRLRGLLAEGRQVFLAADGPLGRELFRLDLPGQAAVIRQGWFTLRRQLAVPVLPITICQNGPWLDVTVHPPLPEMTGDEGADREACRVVLTQIFTDYVRRYPEQCRYLAFPPWET